MKRRMDSRVIRKRQRLFTQQELARALGVHYKTISNLERAPLPDLLLEYLRLVGYRVTFNPVRKGKE
jgi:DNA-binding XRE family transcriptional regulator